MIEYLNDIALFKDIFDLTDVLNDINLFENIFDLTDLLQNIDLLEDIFDLGHGESPCFGQEDKDEKEAESTHEGKGPVQP